MRKFLFDLDGTLTTVESLPLIAKHFNVEADLAELTEQTVAGDIPFAESFTKRSAILGNLPVSEVDKFLGTVPLLPNVLRFIQDNKEHCAIATGNLSHWINTLVKKIGCECFSSEGIIENNKLVRLTSILEKEKICQMYQQEGYEVVFVGDGANDADAMRVADISIASGVVHPPAQSVLSVANYVFYSEEALCHQLYQLKSSV